MYYKTISQRGGKDIISEVANVAKSSISYYSYKK